MAMEMDHELELIGWWVEIGTGLARVMLAMGERPAGVTDEALAEVASTVAMHIVNALDAGGLDIQEWVTVMSKDLESFPDGGRFFWWIDLFLGMSEGARIAFMERWIRYGWPPEPQE